MRCCPLTHSLNWPGSQAGLAWTGARPTACLPALKETYKTPS